VATTKKQPYVNRYFSKEIQEKGKQFIEDGKVFIGGFWQNRTRTSHLLGYGDWSSVPEEIRLYLNQVNRSASKRGKAERKKEKQMQTTETHQAVNTVKPTEQLPLFVISDDVLEDIRYGVQKIPNVATPQQIRTIREYITIQSGFDPSRLLLGVASHMEK
jgi:hypothetical protein